MEAFLKELNLACKHLIEFRDMYEYENRIKTFTDWPFMENCKCTPEHMARAGFIHCPSANEPDVAKCFFCLIELEGWEPNDDPQGPGFYIKIVELYHSLPSPLKCCGRLTIPKMKLLCLCCRVEHSKRPSNCGFLSLAKNFDDLTMEEYYMLEMDRLRTFLVSAHANIV
uniref:Uncharacterized protein n=1 Tax=Chelonoidis abingdonii TaxID=106734 RepID=A0A8C0GJL6_CHEAB